MSVAPGVGLKCHSVLRHLLWNILFKALSPLKQTKLIQMAEHFKLTAASGAKKGEICQLIINYLRKEELVSDGELEDPSATTLQRLELEERVKEREAAS